MAETAFLETVAAFLRGPAGLTPAPASVGIAEPVVAGEVPAVVLSLPLVERLGGGTGGGSEPVTGALPVAATIDLGSPFLPGLPDFSLVSEDRRGLILPHGGLVRADGTEGPVGAADVVVEVNGAPRPVVPPPPAGAQVSVDAREGRLAFATPLPATGSVVARYHVGTWERRVMLLAGRLQLAARAVSAADAERLSVSAVRALLAARLPGLKKIVLEELSAIGAPESDLAGTRTRRASFRFQYEHRVDEPAGAGGIIRRIPIATTLVSMRVDRSTGAPVEEQVTEAG